LAEKKRKQRPRAEPRASRPHMPGYGIADAKGGKGLLTWNWAKQRLTKAHTYWIATARPDGRPHMMPVWGLWLDGAFYFSTGRNSRKAQNLASNPGCVLSMEQDGDSVIVEGVAAPVEDPSLLKQCYKAYKEKYEWDMEDGGEPFYVIRPSVAFGFIETGDQFTTTATRWHFPTYE
jgi:nitroimidazol reductase NimA-like FMN-containing flavoprotein (pyridoxamine 5'-phosphate oxidase superfamily)